MSDQFTPEEVARLKALVSPKKQKTHLIQVLDKSGSMVKGIDITISSYNEMLQVAQKAQQTSGGETTATLVTFGTTAALDYQNVSLDAAVPLSKENYVPDGYTALYDAIGLAIETATKFEKDGDTAFLLQIFTDGGENYSTKFTMPRLKSMIEELNATGKWTVTVAGPQGAIDIFARDLSIAKGNVTSFDPSSIQSRTLNATNMVASTTHYFSARAEGATSIDDAYSAITLTPEIEAQMQKTREAFGLSDPADSNADLSTSVTSTTQQ